jgi:hypothetical protein
MKLLLVTALLTFAVCVAALGCGDDGKGSTTSNADAPATFYGVVPQGLISSEDVDRMGAGKVGTLRLVFPWQALDPSAADDDSVVSAYDPLVIAAAKNGIEVIPTLYGTPDWVAHDLDGVDCSSEEGDTSCIPFAPRSEAALDAWKGFVDEVVGRYGPNGELWKLYPDDSPLPIHTWQIWNEQNSDTFFQPTPDPEAYEALLSTAAETIRKRDPDAEILLGGMFQTSGRGELDLANEFLRELYEIDGATEAFDGVAAHPYAANMEKVEEQVRLLHDEIEAADDDASLWITEMGASSADGDNPLELGEQGQADLLREAFQFFLEKRVEWDIPAVIWYAWRDSAADGPVVCDWCMNAGLFEHDALEPKPSWGAFTSFTGGS